MSENSNTIKKQLTDAIVVLKCEFAKLKWESWKCAKGASHNAIQVLYFLDKVIALVEAVDLALGNFSSDDKRQAGADILDDLIKLPWYLEPFDNHVAKILIDLGVTRLNKMNPDWVSDLKQVIEKTGSIRGNIEAILATV